MSDTPTVENIDYIKTNSTKKNWSSKDIVAVENKYEVLKFRLKYKQETNTWTAQKKQQVLTKQLREINEHFNIYCCISNSNNKTLRGLLSAQATGGKPGITKRTFCECKSPRIALPTWEAENCSSKKMLVLKHCREMQKRTS